MILTGSIESIQYQSKYGHNKKVVTICKELPMLNTNNTLQEKEKLEINVKTEGRMISTTSGTIESIEEKQVGKYTHKFITIIPDHRQKAIIEFRGKNMSLLHGFTEGQEVDIEVFIEAQVSRNSGNVYNNLVGQKIKQHAST